MDGNAGAVITRVQKEIAQEDAKKENQSLGQFAICNLLSWAVALVGLTELQVPPLSPDAFCLSFISQFGNAGLVENM